MTSLLLSLFLACVPPAPGVTWEETRSAFEGVLRNYLWEARSPEGLAQDRLTELAVVRALAAENRRRALR